MEVDFEDHPFFSVTCSVCKVHITIMHDDHWKFGRDIEKQPSGYSKVLEPVMV